MNTLLDETIKHKRSKQTIAGSHRLMITKMMLVLIDALLALLFLYLYSLFTSVYFISPLTILFFVLGFIIVHYLFYGYDLNNACLTRKIIPNTSIAAFIVSITFILIPFISIQISHNILKIGFVVGFVSWMLVFRLLYARTVGDKWYFLDNSLLIYTNKFAEDNPYLPELLEANYTDKVNIKNNINLDLISKADLESYMNQINSGFYHSVILGVKQSNLGKDERLKNLLKNVVQNKIELYNIIQYIEQRMEYVPLKLVGSQFFGSLTHKSTAKVFLGIIQRLIDIVFSAIGLFFFLLMLPFIYILNLFYNKGPLFFEQDRVGQDGIEFKLVKLRSMVTTAEQAGPQMATKNDTRITTFGKILRRYRIDELPQLFNVLKGDMSLIGPRPERKVFVDQLVEVEPFYVLRHEVKPGLSGWAQVKYKYGENLDDSLKKLEYDLYYIKNRSFTLYFRTFLKTISTVIFSQGQ